jgi:hypothetical protein
MRANDAEDEARVLHGEDLTLGIERTLVGGHSINRQTEQGTSYPACLSTAGDWAAPLT